jgi:hypothetical protein
VNGRLDPVEFQERLDRCLGAKTYADLDALVADLPGDAPPRAGRALPWAPRPRRLGLVALALLAVIVASGGHLVWLAFPFFVFFVLRPLVWRGWGHGPGRW